MSVGSASPDQRLVEPVLRTVFVIQEYPLCCAAQIVILARPQRPHECDKPDEA
jgi:hypothetical protein